MSLPNSWVKVRSSYPGWVNPTSFPANSPFKPTVQIYSTSDEHDEATELHRFRVMQKIIETDAILPTVSMVSESYRG